MSIKNESTEEVQGNEYVGIVDVAVECDCELQYAYLQIKDDRYFADTCCEKVENAALGVST